MMMRDDFPENRGFSQEEEFFTGSKGEKEFF
jgi:hypothetical protein